MRELRGGTLRKRRELVDRMKRRKVVQETKWRGSKARRLGVEFYLFCHGGDEKWRRSH